MAERLKIGVDTGGTFTDVVLHPPTGEPVVHKLLSTKDDPGRAVINGVAAVLDKWAAVTGSTRPADPAPLVIHGSTVATNALLEGKVARTAYVTTKGFEDVPWIGRQNRLGLYDLEPRKHSVPLERKCAVGARERVQFDGAVLSALGDAEANRVAARLKELEVESVAICLLHSYANPAHEELLTRTISDALPGVHLTVSSELLPEFREFERASTVIVNACVGPVMSSYIGGLSEHFGAGNLRVMASAGGSLPPGVVAAEPVQTILSGPAGGVAGAWVAAQTAGTRQIITLDMGGTSTDVSLCDGALRLSTEGEIAGLPVKLPMIDIHTVGAGGGSLATLDAGGALRVGPESLGAEPGPASYGRQVAPFRPAVTDAHVVLGHLPVAKPLGGGLKLDGEVARLAVGSLAQQAGLSVEEAALGILRVVEATMARAVRRISVEQGHDPRGYTLLPFGGAGALHAARLAEMLGIKRVLIPANPGLLSAYGMLGTAPLYTFSQAVLTQVAAGEDGYPPLEKLPGVVLAVHKLEAQAAAALEREGIAPSERLYEQLLDLRYVGQSYEISVPLAPESAHLFEERHEELYGYRVDKPIEVVAVRLKASGVEQPVPLETHEPRGEALPEGLGSSVTIQTASGPRKARSLQRSRLLPGDTLSGPVLVSEYSATTLVPEGWRLRVNELKQLELTEEAADAD